ncbi:DUF3558 domain-containing protein [Streptomyces sp. RFCAC02]|uniref:DUF3558 domain-containing protein n=1 Tax=Streptomyces sp. RFCAC02 TaxID=2499143 RepID=UPI0010226FB1|nr:DUF3558 domain-containing protein [Streptomyces sp. RFCAC02]
MDRYAPRFAVRALAWAAVPALLVAGCSSDSSDGDDDAAGETPASVAPTPEPVRFEALPEACAAVSGDTIADVVPEADPEQGSTLETVNPDVAAMCLWSGLDEYQFRSLTVALKIFASEPAVGSGDERAAGYLQQSAEEITGDEANADVAAEALEGAGDEATSISYTVTKAGEDEEDDEEREYRQQRVVVRTGNLVITLDYSATDMEGDDVPGAGDVKEAADAVAAEAVERIDAWAEDQAAAGETADEEEKPADEAGEETGDESGDGNG